MTDQEKQCMENLAVKGRRKDDLHPFHIHNRNTSKRNKTSTYNGSNASGAHDEIQDMEKPSSPLHRRKSRVRKAFFSH